MTFETSTDDSVDITEQWNHKTHRQTSSLDSDMTNRERHPNFHKPDLRLKSKPLDLHLAQRAGGFSRYFIPVSDKDKKLGKLDDPYYYYQTTISNSSSETSLYQWTQSELNNAISDNNGSSRTPSHTHTPSEAPTTPTSFTWNKFDINDIIMTQEDMDHFDDEFPKDFNPFKSPWHYFNPIIYLKHYNLSQGVAVIALLSVLIFGSIGYLITLAKHFFSPIPPEVNEILSPYRYPHLSAIRTSLIDPDTPQDKREKSSLVDNSNWKLVFSDEFNADGRTFFEGDNQFFSGVDIHYAATQDLEYYIPEMIETKNGSLRITLDAFPTNGLQYRSGMLQSWNQLCFSKNAMVEVNIRLAGYSQESGLWPAVWSLGNLARAGYQATTDGVWPYSYNQCDYGITPNQSSPDGISFLPGQRLSKCTCSGEDHPNLGVGRGAPEIDIIEGYHRPHDKIPLGVQTLQVAPFDPWWRPDYDYLTIENPNITFMKPDTGSPTQEAIAANTILDKSWFASIRNNTDYHQSLRNTTTKFQSFGFEYSVDKTPDSDSYIQFSVGDTPTLGVTGDALHPQGDVGWRQISKEPMSLVFNLGLSPTWLDIDFGSLDFPAVFEIDYIRIYQPENETDITCDPSDHPTFQYIEDHKNAYTNVNLTTWEMAGYSRPKNSVMDRCSPPYNVINKGD